MSLYGAENDKLFSGNTKRKREIKINLREGRILRIIFSSLIAFYSRYVL